MKKENKAIRAIVSSMQKKYGDDLILNTGSEGIPTKETIAFGDPVLDNLLRGQSPEGGIIKNAITEISGSEASGKTTLAIELLARIMKSDERAVLFIDTEGGFDPKYASHIGVEVDSDQFIYCAPKDGVMALTVAKNLMETGLISTCVIDSWAGLVPPVVSNADELGKAQVGGLARLSSDALSTIRNLCNLKKVTFIILNQERVNLTPMGPRGKKTTGGNAIVYYSDLRISINKISSGSDDRKIEIKKSRCQAIPFTNAIITIKHSVGLDRVSNLINYAIENDKIEKAGAWFTLPTGKKAQGRDSLAELLQDDKDELKALCEACDVDFFEPRGALKLISKAEQLALESIKEEEEQEEFS